MSVIGMSKFHAMEKLTNLQEQAAEIKAHPKFSPEFEKCRRDVRVAIENLFPDKPQNLADFNQVTFNFSNIHLIEGDFERAFYGQVEIIEAILQSMKDEVRDFWMVIAAEGARALDKRKAAYAKRKAR